MPEHPSTATLLRALRFAADRHRDQRRKGARAEPYINHPIEVAELLARLGEVEDAVTLQAAVLHDVLEDTATTAEELEMEFGPEVRRVVEEVSDDKRLPKAERKRLQVANAPRLSERARLIRLADKLSNVRAMAVAPPADWPPERRRDYLDWTERVVAACRGSNGALEGAYDEALEEARRTLPPGLR